MIVPDGGFVQLPGIPVSGGSASFQELEVTGVSSFIGVATFSSDVYVNGDFVVEGSQVFEGGVSGSDLEITGISTLNQIDSNYGDFVDLRVTGVATVAFSTITDGHVGSALTVGGYIDTKHFFATDATVGTMLTASNITGFAITSRAHRYKGFYFSWC